MPSKCQVTVTKVFIWKLYLFFLIYYHLCILWLKDILPGLTFCMHVCIFMCTYIHSCSSAHNHPSICTNTCLPTSIHTYRFMYVCLHTCIYTCIDSHMSASIIYMPHICICIHVSLYTGGSHLSHSVVKPDSCLPQIFLATSFFPFLCII